MFFHPSSKWGVLEAIYVTLTSKRMNSREHFFGQPPSIIFSNDYGKLQAGLISHLQALTSINIIRFVFRFVFLSLICLHSLSLCFDWSPVIRLRYQSLIVNFVFVYMISLCNENVFLVKKLFIYFINIFKLINRNLY